MSSTKTPITYPCSRCGGSGRYSFNLIHGTMCYGCRGTGRQKTKPSIKTYWQVIGVHSDTGEEGVLYTVRAKTEAGAMFVAEKNYSRASAEFKTSWPFEKIKVRVCAVMTQEVRSPA